MCDVNQRKLIHFMGLQTVVFCMFAVFQYCEASQHLSFSVIRFDALEPGQRPHMINHNHNHNPHIYFAKDGEKKDKTICSKYICERFLRKLVSDNLKCQ